MSYLNSITTGRIRRPVKTVVYGVEGVGKTTFAANAEAPLFISTEDGTAQLDVARMIVTDWNSLMAAVSEIYAAAEAGEFPYKTIVLDSADWAETLAEKAVASEGGHNSIEDFGYGKGYVMVAEYFGKLLRAFDAFVNAGLNVILISHSQIVKFNDPAGDSYDTYSLALSKHVAPKVKEWADCLLFADHDKSTREVGEGFNKRTIAKSWGQRVIYTEHRASHDAKNRYGLPEMMPFDFQQYDQAINAFFNPQTNKEDAA